MRNQLPVLSFVFAVAAACNRAPSAQPEKANPDNLARNYQAATPAAGGGSGAQPMAAQPVAEQGAGSAVTNASASSGSAAAPGGTPLNDAQIARITNDANQAEVAQGKLAREKAKDARVKQFAERMVKHHSEAMDKQGKLKLEVAPSDLARKMEQDAQSTLSNLKSASDTDFDSEYIADQIKEHQQVLDSIDQLLLPNAKNDQLKGYLREIRPTVEAHLKTARELQPTLKRQSASQ
jgi:putative membrane protein